MTIPAFSQDIPDSVALLLQRTSRIEKAEILFRLASDSVESNPGFSLKYISEAISIAVREKDFDLQAKAYRVQADASYYLEDYGAAIERYTLAAEIYKKAHGEETEFYISRLGDVAYCFDMLERQDEAVVWYGKALELAGRAGILEEVAANLANLGRIQTIRGNFQQAVEMMTQALEIDRKSGDDESIASDLNTIGRIYQSWDKHPEAIGYFQQALELDEKAGREDKIAIRLNSIGLSYLDLKEFNKALVCFNQALEIDKRQEDQHKIAVRLNNIGQTYAEMGDFHQAISCLEDAVRIIESLGLEQEMARSYYNLAHYYFNIYNLERSFSDVKKSIALADAHKLKPLQVDNYELLSMIYREKGDYRLSLESYTEYSRLKDEIFTEESDRRMANFFAMYETEKERQKNELLSRDNEISAKRMELLIIIFSSIAALFIMALVILRIMAVSNRNKRIIAEQEAEKLNLELETRNRELAYNAMCIIKNNETMTKMIQGLEFSMEYGVSPEKIRQILHGVSNLEKENSWKEFEVRFTSVHQDFYTHLEERFPDLTPNERKICAFLRLNMSTKDIASLTHQSVNSINVARTRLRKKLNLANSDENLIGFLAKL